MSIHVVNAEFPTEQAARLVGEGELSRARDYLEEACRSGRHWGNVYDINDPEKKERCRVCGAEITPEVEELRKQYRQQS